MEELRKLERVQRMLCFMETLGLSTNDRDSDRFVADFLLFMIQPCGALDIQKRHHLIFEHLQKISPSKLEAVLHSVTEEVEELEAHQNVDNHRIYPEYSTQYDLESTPYSQILKIQSEDEAVIQFSALQRANSTLEDFCRSYFMFHGMDASKAHSIFIFLPVLHFTESYIYHLDNLNEKQMLQSAQDNSVNPVDKFSISDPFDPLIQLLQQQGLMTERIRAEFKLGIEYWKLERKLCDELTKNKDVILIEDVMRAIHLKSFDYRVLNLLLYQLRGQVVNELHMEFLSVSEFLVEVSDDLYDYEEDVVDNTFNILRMFVGIYGPSKAPTMLAKCITEAEEKYERLSWALDPELSLNYWRRYEEAIREGCSSTAAHVVGKWNMPSIIVNEESFRLQANVKNRRASTS